MARVVVTGGAGFLGSHLCDALLARGDEVVAIDNLLTGSVDNIAHLFGRRRASRSSSTTSATYVWVPGDGRRGAALRQPGLARRLPRAIPIQTLKVGSLGTHNAPRPRQGQGRPVLPRLDQRGLRRPAGAPAARDVLGQRQPDRPPRRLRRGQALRRGDDDGVPPPPRPRRRASSASSTPTARGCGPTTGGSCRTSSSRRCAGKPLTIYGDGTPDPQSFCYVDDEVRGLPRPARRRRHRPDQHRQPRRVHDARAGRARARGHRVDARRSCFEPLPGRRPDAAPARHHPRPRACSAGSPRSTSARASTAPPSTSAALLDAGELTPAPAGVRRSRASASSRLARYQSTVRRRPSSNGRARP